MPARRGAAGAWPSNQDLDGDDGPQPWRDADDHGDDDLDEAGHPSTRLREKKARRHRRLVLAGRTSAAVIAIAVLLGAGFSWGTKRWVDDQFRQVAALNMGSAAIVDAPQQRGDENFLLVGSDSRDGAEVEDPAGGARADAIMVVHVPEDRSRVVVVSFPRDLRVEGPACDGMDRGDQAPVTISTAYRHGGPRCVTTVVQQLSGLAVNHFVGMEFGGFKAMVDAADGVQVCVDGPIEDDVLGTVVDRPGTVELSGDGALDFVRARHLAGDTSEHGRIRRQQRLVAALVREAVSDRMLSDPDRLRAFVDAMAASTVADNVSVDQLLELGRSLNGLDAGLVTFVTVPTTGEAAGEASAGGAEELRAADAKALFRALIDGAPLPGAEPAENAPDPAPAAGPAAATVPPEEIKLQVLNGTGQDGLATQIARRLRIVGFEVVKVDNATEREDRTIIRYAAAREPQVWSIVAAVPGAVLQLDPSMGGAMEVVLGADFDGTIEQVRVGEPVEGEPAGPMPASAQPSTGLEIMNGADASCS